MIEKKKLMLYGIKNLDSIVPLRKLSNKSKFELRVLANILPFRTNNYVVEELIDWDNIPADPIYQLNFLQKAMVSEEHFNKVAEALNSNLSQFQLKEIVNQIRTELNPHPAGQLSVNIPDLNNQSIPGVQHKYKETVLIFPSSGQTCHAYCTFCFRWAQFVGINELKFATDESMRFQSYLINHQEVTDVLLTGGDPMIMNSKNLRAYVEPFLKPEFEHIQSIRIGTKSLAYWPYKFVTDDDADDILRLFEEVVQSGKHLTIMAHFNHGKELSTEISREAIKRIRNTGAQIRTQSPLIKHINDDPSVWADMWNEQVRLGLIPYYFFIERNTGAKNYFEVSLEEAFNIYRDAINQVSGLAKTARGPSMSAFPGKISIEGIQEIKGEKVFVLTFLQARNPEWNKRVFFAKYDPKITWFTQLEPAFGEEKFFFQDELDQIVNSNNGQLFFTESSSELVA